LGFFSSIGGGSSIIVAVSDSNAPARSLKLIEDISERLLNEGIDPFTNMLGGLLEELNGWDADAELDSAAEEVEKSERARDASADDKVGLLEGARLDGPLREPALYSAGGV